MGEMIYIELYRLSVQNSDTFVWLNWLFFDIFANVAFAVALIWSNSFCFVMITLSLWFTKGSKWIVLTN